MSDFLLLGGIALCALSIVIAIVQLLRTEPPRAAAIFLVLGIVGVLGSTMVPDSPTEISVSGVGDAWARLTGSATP